MRRTPAQHTQGRSVYLLFEEDHHLAEDSRSNRTLLHADNTFTNLSPNENSSMKNMIDDAIYSASPEIACRRYNPSLGIVLTAGSITLLWANSHASLFTENDMLSQWNLLISSCILCTGIVMICYRLFGDSSAPVEKRSRERLYRLGILLRGARSAQSAVGDRMRQLCGTAESAPQLPARGSGHLLPDGQRLAYCGAGADEPAADRGDQGLPRRRI